MPASHPGTGHDGAAEPATPLLSPVVIPTGPRWVVALVGLAALVAGGTATFVSDVEAPTATLVVAGTVLLLIGAAGALPTRLKIGDHEAEWRREVRQTQARVVEAVPHIDELLGRAKADLTAALSGLSPTPGPDLAQAGVQVGGLVQDVALIESRLGRQGVPAGALLQIGQWYASQQDWAEAARYLEQHVDAVDADWRTWFSLGVSHANRRRGEASDRAALRAYDEAMARLPAGAPDPLTPRLYSYRGAIKKRLGRLPEARVDLQVAEQLAQERYDLVDAVYNLACVEAMSGDVEQALRYVRQLRDLGAVDVVVPVVDVYFRLVKDDPRFQELVRP